MKKETRQHQIIQLIEESPTTTLLSTRDLAEKLRVSEMTVRRDLQELARSGRLIRRHGGAAPLATPAESPRRKEVGILLISMTGKYTDPFYNAVLEGIDSKLFTLGYNIAYIHTQAAISTAAQVRGLLNSHPVSGIILMGSSLGAEGYQYLTQHVRALIQTADPSLPALNHVTMDSYGGIKLMVEHLVKLGYSRLGFITGQYDPRQQAFIDMVKAYGLPADDALCLNIPYGLDGWTPDLGQTGAQMLMRLPNPPDAIVCASDRIAMGAIQWLHQNGLRVPDDIAVTGFDNITESAFTTPPLTTVHVHKQLIGEIAAERAVKCIENEHEIPLFIRTPVHLIIRQSCGAPKSDML